MGSPTHAAWIDLETTSTDERTGWIIEVACIVTTLTPPFEELATLTRPVLPAEWEDALLLARPPWHAILPEGVAAMHRANGLLDDLDAQQPSRREDVDRYLTEWRLGVCQEHGITERRLLLAGSGVAHFETRWLWHHFPRFAGGLTFWTLDVGVLRRALEYAGRHDLVPVSKPKPHRAVDDVRQHLAEFRLITQHLTEAAA